MAIVVLSGVLGAVLYITVPRLLTEVESNLTVDEVSEQLNQLGKQMARISSGRSAPFQRIYDQLIRELSPGWLAGWPRGNARHLFAELVDLFRHGDRVKFAGEAASLQSRMTDLHNLEEALRHIEQEERFRRHAEANSGGKHVDL